MSTIAPGNKIQIQVVKQPSNDAARKTIVRLLSKDAGVQKENRRLKRVRKVNQTLSTRGGRLRVWESRLVKQHPVAGQVGESGVVVATLDILQDIDSVKQFVEVTSA